MIVPKTQTFGESQMFGAEAPETNNPFNTAGASTIDPNVKGVRGDGKMLEAFRAAFLSGQGKGRKNGDGADYKLKREQRSRGVCYPVCPAPKPAENTPPAGGGTTLTAASDPIERLKAKLGDKANGLTIDRNTAAAMMGRIDAGTLTVENALAELTKSPAAPAPAAAVPAAPASTPAPVVAADSGHVNNNIALRHLGHPTQS